MSVLHRWRVLSLLCLLSACESRRETPETIAAGDSGVPVSDGMLSRGLLAVAGNDTTFVACDETDAQSVIDQTGGELKQATAGLGPGPGERIYLVVRGVDVRSPAQGPGVRYRDALRITRVLRASHPGEGGGCHVPTPAWQFSARGNEPFWGVKVYSDSIVLNQPDDPSSLVFPGVVPTLKGTGRVWVTSRPDHSHRLVLSLADTGCADGMSGEYFSFAAQVTLDGALRRGCAEAAYSGP